MAKKLDESPVNAIDAKFLSADGSEVNVKDLITQEECWYLKREKKWVLTHNAIKKIARVAGISPNYEVKESEIKPSYENELEHIVRVTIRCNANSGLNNLCVHRQERELTVTGEANRISAPNRGRGYLRKMAEKRAYDIAVLEHIGIYSSIFSEEEAEGFSKDEEDKGLMPGTIEFEDISQLVNDIVNAPDTKELTKIGMKIKKDLDTFSENQVLYLRKIFKKQYAEKYKKAKPF